MTLQSRGPCRASAALRCSALVLSAMVTLLRCTRAGRLMGLLPNDREVELYMPKESPNKAG